jgi:hypothetical protein
VTDVRTLPGAQLLLELQRQLQGALSIGPVRLRPISQVQRLSLFQIFSFPCFRFSGLRIRFVEDSNHVIPRTTISRRQVSLFQALHSRHKPKRIPGKQRPLPKLPIHKVLHDLD